MIESDGAKYLIALAVTLVTSTAVLVSGRRSMPGPGHRTASAAVGEMVAASEAAAASGPFEPGSRRPRIFTGEPVTPEPHRPATKRAARLVGGVAVLAAAGALALIAFVRALMLLFQRIGD